MGYQNDIKMRIIISFFFCIAKIGLAPLGSREFATSSLGDAVCRDVFRYHIINSILGRIATMYAKRDDTGTIYHRAIQFALIPVVWISFMRVVSFPRDDDAARCPRFVGKASTRRVYVTTAKDRRLSNARGKRL